MTDKNNLYDILELDINATSTEIKNNFKKLALKFHPDKNKDENSKEIFNQIRIAYDVLSNPDKRKKYDDMHETKKSRFTETIFLFLKEIMNIKSIRNIMNNPDIIKDIKNKDVANISKKLINKILDDVNDEYDFDIDHIAQIFIHTSDIKQVQAQTKNNQDDEIRDEPYSYDTSNYDTLNIIGNVKITIDDIYHNRLKEVIIKRKIYDGCVIKYETKKYNIPLYDPQVIIVGAGDKTINIPNKKDRIGDVIINVRQKIDKINQYSRDGYDINYNGNIMITLNELFNGFNKTIDCYGTKININSVNPLKEYKFDGNQIYIIMKGKGLPRDKDGNRGDLNIILNLNKSPNFNENLKKYFN
jgi:DnaJ-class molecular chaperone